ncbi:hypothetical protein DXT99_02615 [Pontibacter diazotrophicus]|uniref:Twin-arginine translocation signal domain-containing protein n=1 Tax=Pontibacter diazotrophicus TaxID=1400979 RepID=A0A3D8LHG9_9BACT|nr:twin-arginine translocation signal domain-containing protein [Pontibacter diazotrophicus]RDV16694.1 hypothetical protein DXT99_02615 [Pontibacter diazotrophicus]
MNRRLFLKLTGAGAALAALPGMGFMYTSYSKAARGLILQELDYLALDIKGVERFVQDYAKGKSDNYLLKVRGLYLLRSSASKSKVVEELVKDYLLATDFFRNRMDESKPVMYLGLYDPYKTPCANPFSSVYYPPLAT